MSRQLLLPSVVLAVVSIAATGCRPQQPGYLFEDGDLSHYVGVATQIEYPDVPTCSLDEVKGAQPPLTLDNSKPKEYWDLTLEEAVRITLKNSNVIRNIGGIAFGTDERYGGVEDPTQLFASGSAVTTYDVAMTESDARYGTEAALSAFDAQFATAMNWQHGITLQNNSDLLSSSPTLLIEDQATFQSQLSKTNATGGTVSISHNVSYLKSNVPEVYKLYPSAYWATVEMAVRQPLLQGFGAAYNRIAGPGAIPGFNNGVVIARLRTDLSLCEFERAVRELVSQTEKVYWETYFAYRRVDTAVAAQEGTLTTWRKIQARYGQSIQGGAAQDEAQARQQYFLYRGEAEKALNNLYTTENRLRFIMGLTHTDGRLIRPADEPTTARVSFDWCEAHAEALARSVELRGQKWKIKQREMEIVTAKNYLLPRLDAVAQYTWGGMGHSLMADGSEPSAYSSLTANEAPGWLMGFEFRMPLGFRKEMAGVRNAQLALARERAIYQEMELEVSEQLALAFRQLTDRYVIAETEFNRRISAQREKKASDAALEQFGGSFYLNLALQAQQHLAEAEYQYYRMLIDYVIAISDVHRRKGSLLEYNGVCLAEGPWPGKAYFDALRRARARDASVYMNYGYTQPPVMSRGPVVQNAGTAAQGAAEPGSPEAIPAPAPEPAGQLSPPSETPQGTPRSTRSGAPAEPALNAAAANAARPANRSQTRFDLGSMNLSGLSASKGAVPATTAATATAAGTVQRTAYQEVSPAEGAARNATSNGKISISIGNSSSTSVKPAGDGWKGAGRSDQSNEPVADLPPAQTDQSSSGWKRIQR